MNEKSSPDEYSGCPTFVVSPEVLRALDVTEDGAVEFTEDGERELDDDAGGESELAATICLVVCSSKGAY
jgi:hypothetical protein